MARRSPVPAANNETQASIHRKAELPKSFGRPLPVVCDEEAGWFEGAATETAASEAAQSYIRDRFQELLEPEEIEQLASNDVMLEIIAAHQELFRTQAQRNVQAA